MALNRNAPLNGNFVSIKHQALCKELRPAPVTDEQKEAARADGYEERDVQNPSDPKPDGTFGTVKKWITLFGSISNSKITAMDWYDRVSNDVRYMGLKMKFKDVETEEVVILDLPFGSKGYDVFTRVMENIDYSKPVELRVWPDKKKANSSAVVWYQDEHTIKWRYTQEYNSSVVHALGANPQTQQLAVELHEALEANALSPDLIDRVGQAGYVLAPPPVHNLLGKPQWNFDNQRAFLWNRLTTIIMPRVKELNPEFNEPFPEEEDPTFDPATFSEVEPTTPEFSGPPQTKPAGAVVGWTPPGTEGKVDRAF